MVTLSSAENWRKVFLATQGFDVCFINSIGLFDIWSEIAAFFSGARDLRGPRAEGIAESKTVYTQPFVFGCGHETLVNFRGAGGLIDDNQVAYPLLLPKRARSSEGPAIVVLHPGSSDHGQINRWNPSNYACVGRKLSEKNVRVILVGTPSETDLLNQIKAEARRPLELLVNLDLKDLALLLAEASLVIANDSGIGHLAASVQAPLITIMGATLPEKIAPVGNNVTILGPRCTKGGCYGRLSPNDCDRCIDFISPEEVLDAALKQMA